MSKPSEAFLAPRKTTEYALVAAAGFAAVQTFKNHGNKRRATVAAEDKHFAEMRAKAEAERRSEIEELAGIDELTSLRTRRVAKSTFKAMQEAYRIRKQAQGNRRSSDLTPNPLEDTHALVLLDIDHFGEFNKKYGENYGDTILRQVAGELIGGTRKNDLDFRWGGEELGSILTHITLEDAFSVAGKICRSIESTNEVTVSIGVAPLNLDAPIETSVEMADLAMREAKQNGKNQVVQFSPDKHHLPAGL